MDAELNSNDETPPGDKHPLPVGEAAPTAPPIETVNPSTPSSGEQNISTALDEKSCNEAIPKSNDPLSVRIIKDDGLNSFERKTITLGKVGIAVAFLSLVAACIAGFYVFQQFKEMSDQTEILNRAAEQARIDSKDAAITTAKQLTVLQKQVVAAQDSVRAIKRNMEVQQRAWVGLGVQTIVTSVAVKDNRLEIEFRMGFKNFGNSPALRMMGEAGVVTDGSTIKREQNFSCEALKKFANADILEFKNEKGETGSIDRQALSRLPRIFRKDWRDIRPIEKHGSVLFPGDISLQPEGSGIPSPATPSVVYFAGCIIYWDQFSSYHETRFCQESPAVFTELSPGQSLINCSTHNTAN